MAKYLMHLDLASVLKYYYNGHAGERLSPSSNAAETLPCSTGSTGSKIGNISMVYHPLWEIKRLF